MQFIKHQLPGVIECVPTKFFDERGHFYESYNQNLFSANGISENFVQDNYSFSIAGVPEYFRVNGNETIKVAGIQLSAGGSLYVTEMV